MKYAYTQDNTVAQVLRVPPTNIYAPEFAEQFIECPDEVEPGWMWDGKTFKAQPAPPFDRAAASLQIDDAVADIYNRFTRFGIEYEEREAQALAYKAAGYTGTVPARVSEFATPAGMPAKAATDLILSQSANLRTAQGALSALRMRKYEVLRAATDAQAQAAADAILQAIAAVGANVS